MRGKKIKVAGRTTSDDSLGVLACAQGRLENSRVKYKLAQEKANVEIRDAIGDGKLAQTRNQ